MLSPYQIRSLISAQNIQSHLLTSQWVRSDCEISAFKTLSKGIPILLPADKTLFEFSRDDIFSIRSETLAEIIYGPNAENYIGFKNSHRQFNFLSKFEVKRSVKSELDKINETNKKLVDHIEEMRTKHRKLGAFQTRNIPHFGHEKIISKMLERCDHLVINPVIGPKKRGDITIDCLKFVFEKFLNKKLGNNVSFMPVFANMYYAGPREAVHHALLRQRLGFNLFSIGRDHAGAEGFYSPLAAVQLVRELESKLKIEVYTHDGAYFCSECREAVLSGECCHPKESIRDIAGTSFRNALLKGDIFELADPDMQQFVLQNNGKIFED